jgi:lipopolysaccharide biosynthesis regulator YciM
MGKVLSFSSLVAAVVWYGCGGEDVDPAQRAAEIITARTVGLAYLEENQLPEAEAEFLKLIDLAPDEYPGYANLGLVYLRMNRYQEAEERLDEALRLQPDDPDVQLLLSELYKATGRTDEAIEILERALNRSAGHAKILYALAQLYARRGDEEGSVKSESYLALLVASDSTNIAARLQLAETLVRNGSVDSALDQLEEIRRQVPQLPREASEFYDEAERLLRQGNAEDALAPAIILHNFMKVTPLYQQGLIDLQGPGGESVGFPIFTFTQNIGAAPQSQEAVLAAIRFTDATEAAGLNVVGAAAGDGGEPGGGVATADYDFDGDQDLYIAAIASNGSGSAGHLFRNDFGHFVDVTTEAGLPGEGGHARFADFDNDSLIDLYIARDGPNVLYKNQGDGSFIDVTAAAGLGEPDQSNTSVFVDADHDGDLDLYVGNTGANRLYQNSGSGSFRDVAEQTGTAGGMHSTNDVAFADFDEDGDIDLFVVNQDANSNLYTNLRQGRFADIARESGVNLPEGSAAVAIGDYDNDGFSDVFLTGSEHSLLRNRGDGTLTNDTRSPDLLMLNDLSGRDVTFLDFDNDGHLDLFVTGSPRGATARGSYLFHNDGSGRFDDMSDLLPEDMVGGSKVATADYNEDGDIDLFVAGLHGGVRLLRNDGGNANRYIKLQLTGLSAGSGKNNSYGIGAKIEVRAGELYQMRVVTSASTHFGLGSRLKADVVRIVWTNGVPQNVFFPGSDQDLVEEQVLKGSCGFLYTWTGERYDFLKDMVWKSAIGMPMGIMGGRTAYAPPYASREYLRIPGDVLHAKDGAYSIQITEELWETLYLDELRLIAVDHPESVDVFVDEGFEPTSPDAEALEILQVPERRTPVTATNENGADLLAQIRKKDDVYVSGFTPARYQGVTKLHDLVIALDPQISNRQTVRLFLNGWIFPTDASINVAMSQSSDIESVAPYVQVVDEEGRWQTVIDNMSFPMGKAKTMVVDMSGHFLSSQRLVRIRTNMEIYWDYIFYTVGEVDGPLQLTTLEPTAADLHYRGFSRMYRKGGPDGPHWFDYSDVSTDPKWLDMEGYYTRYGDVLPLLLNDDSKYIIMNAGDEVTVEFGVDRVPEVPEGWKRDYLIYSTGWLKDADINTATGQTVDPLPFHGMSRYPYGREESYPNSKEYRQYLREYNTRKVTIKK